MDTDYCVILAGLEALRTAPRRPKMFGADAHGYCVNPPLSEDAVRRFEREHGIVLPADYRGFLLHVGNGGAGPYYGLFRLGEMDDGHGRAAWRANGGFVGTLSEPFPHTAAWNDPTGEPAYNESKEADPAWEDDYQRRLSAWERVYWNTANVNGAIPICHLGCAYRQWLVVTGPERGNVWCDDRADHKGLYPLARDGAARTSFMRWYRAWLDEALGKIRRR